LYWKPPVTCTFIDIYFHLYKFFEYVIRPTEYCIMQGTPTFLAKLVDYLWLFLLNFKQGLFIYVFWIILKNIQKPHQIFLLD